MASPDDPQRVARPGDRRPDLDAQLETAASAFATLPAERASVGARLLGFVIGHRKLFLAIGAVLVAGGLAFGVCTVVRYRLRTVPGQPIAELFLADRASDTIIVLEYVAIGKGDDGSGPTASGMRLTAIDGRTGKQLAVDVTDYQRCWAGGPKLWCLDEYDRIDLLAPRTLAVEHHTTDLIAAAGLAKPTHRHTTAGDEIVIVLEDGRGARISPTAAVNAVDSVPQSFSHPSSGHRCAGSSRVALDDTTLVLSPGTRNVLRTDPPPPAESATPASPALTFLEGEFLLTSPALPIVLHRATLGGPHVLSRVTGMSHEQWSRPLRGACRLARPIGDTLVIVTDHPGQRVVAIDLASGQLAWQFGR